ncbi:MAG: HEPN domain-containing protein [Lyngbya sp.]|nr:HEPN domain-containing protein [Lyngbya sp.]
MTPEQQALLQKASRSLEAARILNQQNLPEFAVSRAYYTMFYIAEAFLEGEGLSYSRHSAVISEFGRLFANTGRVPVEFHRYLIVAEQIRRRGDYNIDPSVTIAQAEEQIQRAEEFIVMGQELLNNPSD